MLVGSVSINTFFTGTDVLGNETVRSNEKLLSITFIGDPIVLLFSSLSVIILTKLCSYPFLIRIESANVGISKATSTAEACPGVADTQRLPPR